MRCITAGRGITVKPPVLLGDARFYTGLGFCIQGLHFAKIAHFFNSLWEACPEISTTPSPHTVLVCDKKKPKHFCKAAGLQVLVATVFSITGWDNWPGGPSFQVSDCGKRQSSRNSHPAWGLPPLPPGSCPILSSCTWRMQNKEKSNCKSKRLTGHGFVLLTIQVAGWCFLNGP